VDIYWEGDIVNCPNGEFWWSKSRNNDSMRGNPVFSEVVSISDGLHPEFLFCNFTRSKYNLYTLYHLSISYKAYAILNVNQLLNG
jgi:hypothetical protein